MTLAIIQYFNYKISIYKSAFLMVELLGAGL